MDENDNMLLEKFDFLQKLTPEERKHFLEAAVYRKIPAGTIAMSENNSCFGIAFVLSGELRIFKVSDSGREISLYLAKAGETCVITVACLLGIGKSISPVSVMATQDSKIAAIPCDTFRYHFANSPYIQQFIFKNTLEKFYDLIGLVERLMFKSVTERIWEFMLDETARGKKPLYTTHAQLAARLGTSREVVTRRLHELEGAGLIKIERGKLLLLKPEANVTDLRPPLPVNA